MSNQPQSPGKGFRFLRVGEKIRKSDQVYPVAAARWRRMGDDFSGAKVRRGPGSFPVGFYRRAVKKF